MARGSEMLEIDCQMTADGEVVVCHDHHLGRLAGLDDYIQNFTYKLPPLLGEVPLDFEKECVYSDESGDRRIPLLREVFDHFPTVPINIDVKDGSEELAIAINDLIVKYARESITVWGNHRDSTCDTCYRLNPDIPLLVPKKKLALLILSFYTGLLPFISIRESFLELPIPSVFLKTRHALGLSSSERFMLKALDLLMMRPAFFDHLKRRGLEVYLWVLNSEEEFGRALQLGATGIMTDFPSRLTQFLQRNPHLVPQEEHT